MERLEAGRVTTLTGLIGRAELAAAFGGRTERRTVDTSADTSHDDIYNPRSRPPFASRCPGPAPPGRQLGSRDEPP